MAQAQLNAVVQGIGRLFSGPGTVSGLGERQLLERFVRQRDEAAFEALVARHGPAVYGVCRRLLGDPHAADDAFQAVFLVLVRRAATIRDPDRLGPWLHGVALKVARRARQQAARRQAHEKGGDALAAFEPAGDGPPGAELGPDLHEELGRLPAKYRDPIVLCDLEGRTHEEAARLLRWPVGTVKGRLSRARDQLRQRLVRRGLAPSVGGIVLALHDDAKAAVPQVLFDQTVRAAMGFAAGAGGAAIAGSASATALNLANGVVTTMFHAKLKSAAAMLVMAGAVAGGTGAFAYQYGGFGPGEGGAAAQVKTGGAQEGYAKAKGRPATDRQTMIKEAGTPPDEDDVEKARRELERARLGPLQDLYEQAVQAAKSPPSVAGLNSAKGASEQLLRAEHRLAESDEQRLAAVAAHAARMSELKKLFAAGGDGGGFGGSPPMTGQLNVFEAEARLWLAQARAGRPLTGLNLEENASPNGPAAGGMMGSMMSMMGSGGAGMMGPAAAPAAPPSSMMGMGMAGMMGMGGAEAEAPGGKIALVAQEDDPQNQAIAAVLEKAVPMPFPEPVPLEDVIKYIRQSTQGEELANGLPIYFDRSTESESGQSAQQALGQPVTMELEGVRLKTTLRLLLKQVGMGYMVKDGAVIIGYPNTETFQQELNPDLPDEGALPGYGEMPRHPQTVSGAFGGKGAGAAPGGAGGLGGGFRSVE